MEPSAFRERLSECLALPGSGDPAYSSAMNVLIQQAGGSVTLPGPPQVEEKFRAALDEDQGREWSPASETPMDRRLAAFADLYREAGAAQRSEIESSFEGEQLRELLVFARRAARFAASTKDTRWLRLGLAAVAIEGTRYDFRDSYLALALLRFAAESVGADTGALFGEARQLNEHVAEAVDRVSAFRQREVQSYVRRFGPPEWAQPEPAQPVRDQKAKPWWKLW
jgi:hypothetical protein